MVASTTPADLDAWITIYNDERTHQGKMCRGRIPRAFDDGKRIWKEKLIGGTAAHSRGSKNSLM